MAKLKLALLNTTKELHLPLLTLSTFIQGRTHSISKYKRKISVKESRSLKYVCKTRRECDRFVTPLGGSL